MHADDLHRARNWKDARAERGRGGLILQEMLSRSLLLHAFSSGRGTQRDACRWKETRKICFAALLRDVTPPRFRVLKYCE